MFTIDFLRDILLHLVNAPWGHCNTCIWSSAPLGFDDLSPAERSVCLYSVFQKSLPVSSVYTLTQRTRKRFASWQEYFKDIFCGGRGLNSRRAWNIKLHRQASSLRLTPKKSFIFLKEFFRGSAAPQPSSPQRKNKLRFYRVAYKSSFLFLCGQFYIQHAQDVRFAPAARKNNHFFCQLANRFLVLWVRV